MRLPQYYAYFSCLSLEGWGYSARRYKTEVKIKKTNLKNYDNSIKTCKEVTV